MNVEKAAGKTWRWIVVSVAIVFAGVVCLAAFRHDRYSFLNRFHPRIVDVDLAKMMGAPPPGTKGAPVIQRPSIKMYVFRNEDAGQVLIAMQKELTPGRGFGAQHRVSGGDDKWDFYPGGLPPPGVVRLPDGTAMYSFGQMAAAEEEMYETGTLYLTYGKQGGKPACIVILFHEVTWLDRSLGLVREFLHLG